MKNVFLLTILMFLVSSSFVVAQEQTSYQSFSYWLKGKIATSEFEMLLTKGSDNGEYIAISGEYYYTSVLHTFPITGKYYTKLQKLVLFRTENNSVKETFEINNFDGNKGEGTWIKGEKTLACTVESIKGIDKDLFIDKMEVYFGKNLEKINKESFKILNTTEIKMLDRACNDFSVSNFIAGTLVQFSCYEGSDNNTFAMQVIPNSAEPTVVCYSYGSGFGMKTEEDGECFYNLNIEVWKKGGKGWEKKHSQALISETIGASGCGHYGNLVVSSKKIAIQHNVDETGENPKANKTLRWEWTGTEYKTIK